MLTAKSRIRDNISLLLHGDGHLTSRTKTKQRSLVPFLPLLSSTLTIDCGTPELEDCDCGNDKTPNQPQSCARF